MHQTTEPGQHNNRAIVQWCPASLYPVLS